MKKLFVIVITLLATSFTYAQENFIEKVTVGFIPGICATTDFSGNTKPFNLGYGLLSNITIETSKTYHDFMYGFDDHSIKFLTGYYLPRKWDVYSVYSKEISNRNQYLGIGIEKLVKAGGVNTFLFGESGTDFKGTTTLTVGVLISIQSVIFQDKKL